MSNVTHKLRPVAHNAPLLPVDFDVITALIKENRHLWIASTHSKARKYSTTAYDPERHIAFRAFTEHGVKVQLKHLIKASPNCSLINKPEDLPVCAIRCYS